MKVISGIPGSHPGVGLLRTTALVALALGVSLALLFAAGPVEAGEGDGFLIPIVLEEGRTPPPDVADPPGVRDVPQVRTVVDPPSVRDVRQVQGSGVGITQTSGTLIKNDTTMQTVDLTIGSEQATSFTTGSNSLGYTLTSVTMGMRAIGTVSNYSVSIRANSNGKPGTTLGTLTKSGSLPTSHLQGVDFPASGGGIDLAANTTYWLVASENSSVIVLTTYDDYEGGGLAGWSIGDVRRSNPPNWNGSDSGTLVMDVNGYVKTFADTTLPANFDCNTYLGWEHTNGRQWDSADGVWRQVGSYYYNGQYANTGYPICELRFSSVGPGSYADKLGYGLTLCSQAPTWQTIDPETGEAVGGPAEKHYTGHKTSSGQDICSDFDGLRSTKKYRQEQQLKQFCMRAENRGHALCN